METAVFVLLKKGIDRKRWQTETAWKLFVVIGFWAIITPVNGLCEEVLASESSESDRMEEVRGSGIQMKIPRARTLTPIVDGLIQITRTGVDQVGPVTVISGFPCVDFPEACLHIEHGRFDEAADTFLAEMLKGDDLAAIGCGWANALFLEGRLEEATRAYILMAEDFPNDSDIRTGLGNIYAQIHVLGSAKKVFRSLMKEPRYVAVAHNNLGNAYRFAGRFAEALEEYQWAIHEDPGLMAAEYNRGGVLLALKRFDQAAQAFRSAAGRVKEFADAYLYEGLAHLRANQAIPAVVALYRALDLGVDNQATHLALGVALRILDLDRKAVFHLRRAKELGPTDQRILTLLSTSLVRIGEMEKAAQIMLEDFAMGPQDADSHFVIGSKLYLCEQYAQAAAYLQKAADLGRREADTYLVLGQALLESGNIDSSIGALLLASKLSPQSAQVHFFLGVALAHRGRFVQAIREIEAALALNPLDVDTKTVLMDLFRQTDNFNACARMGRMIVNRIPDSASFRFETAYCQAMTGDLDQAAKMLEIAMDQDIEGSQVHKVWRMLIQQTLTHSKVPGMYLLLGMIQERRGDWKDAIHSYRRFISLSPSTHWARRISEAILRVDLLEKEPDPAFSGVP